MKNIIAIELSNLGFTTRITQTGVLVSLKRPVSQMEVEMALEQAFEGIQFKLYHIHSNMVHVVTKEAE
jgi:hypothetical protein